MKNQNKRTGSVNGNVTGAPKVHFLLRCNDVLDQMRIKESDGSLDLHAFVEILHKRFCAEMSGVVLIEAEGAAKVVFAPAPNPAVFENTDFGEWLDEGGRSGQLASKIRELESGATKHGTLETVSVRPRNNPAAPPDTYKYSPFQVILKLPRVYPHYEGSRHCYLVLVYSDMGQVLDPDQIDLQLHHLSSLLDTWAWGMTHQRSKLADGIRRLVWVHRLESSRIETAWKNLVSATKHLSSLLSIVEIVRIAEISFHVDKDDKGESLIPPVLECLGRDLQEWKMEYPPNWPPVTGFIPPRKLVLALIYWCQWRDRGSKRVAKIGECRKHLRSVVSPVSAGGSSGPDLRLVNAIKRIGKEMVRLPRLAMNSIGTQLATGGSLLLRKNTLGVFFLSQALHDRDRLLFWKGSAPSDEEVSKHLSGISCLANYGLGGLPLDSDTIEATVGMLSEFMHHQLGVPARISLRQHLFLAARVEPTLHVLKKFYRDHFFHAIEVAFMGHFLLEVRDHNGIPLWRRVATIMGCPDDKKRVLQLWYVAALLHDLGYIMEAQIGIRSKFEFFHHCPELEQFGKDLDSVVSSLSQKLGSERFMGYDADHKPGEDHGVIGAKHLEALLDGIAKDDPAVKPAEYKPAIQAISRHNSRVHTVCFKEDPLSALLILCDTIQEWARPRLDYNTAHFEMLSWLRSHGSSEHDLMGPLKHMELDVVHRSGAAGGHFALKRHDALHIRLCFDKRINRNHEVFKMWLDASANLQRLDLEGSGLTVDLEFETPLPHVPYGGGSVESHFHQLRDAARETHMDFLDRWFPDRQDGDRLTNGAVSYFRTDTTGDDGDSGKEHLVLHLNELFKNTRITRGMSDFYKCLQKWKRSPEELDYRGEYALPDYPT